MNRVDPAVSVRPTKIQCHHLERWAIDYVRQSGPQQVQRHRESAQVQANLQERALAWGWPAERVRVLDGDQGRSGTSTVGRDDFAWLLSEIALGHVGLVLCFQINRLAREDEECCRLIRVCAAFDTLLADEDGLYHPHDFNDRMILTIKGLMGGFELHQLQQRMQAGRLNRCRRGEWLGQTPPGYVVGPGGKLQFDPDEQVQDVIRLILEQFNILGSISALQRYLRQHKIELPFRAVGGPDRGQLRWRAPHRETVRLLVCNPAHAGAYAWGRHATDPRRVKPGRRGTGRVRRELEECAVLIRNNHPAYITWEQYEDNVRRLKQHRRHGPVPGPARGTVALLAGLVVCGQCGSRMQTRYTKQLRYDCQRRNLDYAAPRCQSLAGAPLEQLVRDLVLEVVTPASLELSVRAAQECEQERAALDRQWQLRLERAAQDASRAFRQYNAVEPENRLVARTLERAWEESLLSQRALEEEYRRFQKEQPVQLSAEERRQIETLARNLPGLWQASQTSLAEKRQIVRRLLQTVVVWAPASSQEVKVQLHWAYGTVTEHQILRPVHAWNQVAGAADFWRQAREWQAAGWTSQRIAEALNGKGHRTPHGRSFTAESVRKLTERGGPQVSKNRKATSRRTKKAKISGGSTAKTDDQLRPAPGLNGQKSKSRAGKTSRSST
jgi:DNA invertase Pin-like site-specific DNA recombinase